MIVQPTALNVIIIGLSVVIFSFLWKMAGMALIDRNPDSGLGQAMLVAL